MSNDLWETPPDVFERIQEALNVHFIHDVCATQETAKCPSFWGPENNALVIEWAERIHGYVGAMAPRLRSLPASWMNPPYSDPTPWVRKAAEESAKGLIVVGLVIHDPSTKWFQQYVENVASVVYMPDRRISFLQDGNPVNGNPKPSAVVLWTPWRTGQTQYVRFSLPEKKRKAA